MMLAEVEIMAVAIFALFVLFVLGLSFYLGRRAKSASGYFAAGGQIHWSVNGISFAGDYLSAASFLGICGLLAVKGYDGFLYSIGYLAGWIVALFVVAEPMKRLGKYTFTDALDSVEHADCLDILPDSADGRRGRAGDAPAGLAACGGRDYGRGDRDFHCRHGRHGFDDVRAVPQGQSADCLFAGDRHRRLRQGPEHRARPERHGGVLQLP
jgi:hypothetical protein